MWLLLPLCGIFIANSVAESPQDQPHDPFTYGLENRMKRKELYAAPSGLYVILLDLEHSPFVLLGLSSPSKAPLLATTPVNSRTACLWGNALPPSADPFLWDCDLINRFTQLRSSRVEALQ
ncbi:putative FXYD domain-containing ion transport regulator protein, partial [Naja naja]